MRLKFQGHPSCCVQPCLMFLILLTESFPKAKGVGCLFYVGNEDKNLSGVSLEWKQASCNLGGRDAQRESVMMTTELTVWCALPGSSYTTYYLSSWPMAIVLNLSFGHFIIKITEARHQQPYWVLYAFESTYANLRWLIKLYHPQVNLLFLCVCLSLPIRANLQVDLF